MPDKLSVVLITSRSFGTGSVDVVGRIAAAGYDVVRASSTHALDELAPLLPDAVGWIAGTGAVGVEHLDRSPRLRVVARYGLGVDAVDLRATRERGVVVTNTPGVNSASVAEHTIALMFSAVRGIPAADRRARRANWSAGRPARELSALTVGVVGLGRIGRGVSARLAALGATVIGHDPLLPADDAVFDTVGRADLREVAREADVVTLHAPGGRTIIDPQWFDGGGRAQVVVNTARAALVDETAVAAALRSGRCAAYAADTLAVEHTADDSPLFAPDLADRVTVTPHLGAQTVEAIDGMGSTATAELLAVLSGRQPRFPVSAEPPVGAQPSPAAG